MEHQLNSEPIKIGEFPLETYGDLGVKKAVKWLLILANDMKDLSYCEA